MKLYFIRCSNLSCLLVAFLLCVLVQVIFLFVSRKNWNSNHSFNSEINNHPITTTMTTGILAEQKSSSDPLQQLHDFVNHNPNTPAALLVPLLRKYLHTPPTAEVKRTKACSRHWNDKLCFGGFAFYSEHGNVPEEEIPMVLWEDDPHAMNMYNLTHYPNGKKHLGLGTSMACIPLILAGFAATSDPNNVVIELGPFLGLSTKCIAIGMRKNGIQNNTLFVYDTFKGTMNFNAIQRMNPWLKNEHPEYNKQNDSFHFLWEYGVKPTYPTVISRQGFINNETLTPKILGDRPVAFISIDSAKSNQYLQTQLAGLGPLMKGSILMMMDFESVSEHIVLFFACLREQYVLPVYVSWNMEHWMWIITKDVDLADGEHYQCYEEYMMNKDLNKDHRTHVLQLAEQDLFMLSGLTNNSTTIEAFADPRNRLWEKLSSKL